MTSTTRDKLSEGEYYIAYGNNWLSMFKILEIHGTGFLCDLNYSYLNGEELYNYDTAFQIVLLLEDYELFKMEDHEVHSELLFATI